MGLGVYGSRGLGVWGCNLWVYGCMGLGVYGSRGVGRKKSHRNIGFCYDDLLTGPSDLDAQSGHEGGLPVTARRAKRENGGLGEDPPGSTMTY
jgi:hypothetical protein